MKKTFILTLTCLLIAVSLSAGRYAGDYMIIGSGVRAMGMGGAFAALADDGSAVFWNASGISGIRQREATAMHAFLYNGLASYDNITYVQPLPNDVSIGLNLTRLTISKIPYFSEEYLINTSVDERINNSALHLPACPMAILAAQMTSISLPLPSVSALRQIWDGSSLKSL